MVNAERSKRSFRTVCLQAAAVSMLLLLFAAHFVHLRADFPTAQWRDWAIYTDEGWYGKATIVSRVRAHLPPLASSWQAAAGSPRWFVDGDFDPAVALPVWPLVLNAVFHFTGVNMTAARSLSVAIFGADCVLLFLLIAGRERRYKLGLLAAALVSSSAYLFAFSRLAILEPLAVCFLLLALLLADRSYPTSQPRYLGRMVVLGCVCALLLLTKTMGLFLLPGVLYLVWARAARRKTSRLLTLAVVAGIFGLVYGGYVAVVYRAGFGEDFGYLFTANNYSRPNGLRAWLFDLGYTLHGVFWTGRILPWLALLGLLAGLFRRGLASGKLCNAAWISMLSYGCFLCWHNNPAPHYYLPFAFLMVMVLVTAVETLLRQSRIAVAGVLVLLTLAIASGILQIAGLLFHPRYTLVDAASGLTAYIDQHPNGNRILLSSSGDEIMLMTGLPAICDDYGTDDLSIRIARYRPGWFAAWDDVDPDVLANIHTLYWLERVAAFPATGDPERNLLVLYRLHPLPGLDQGVVVDQ